MSDSEELRLLRQRIDTLEAYVDELRTVLGLNVHGPPRPPEMCIACGYPCEGKGGDGHPVALRRC